MTKRKNDKKKFKPEFRIGDLVRFKGDYLHISPSERLFNNISHKRFIITPKRGNHKSILFSAKIGDAIDGIIIYEENEKAYVFFESMIELKSFHENLIFNIQAIFFKHPDSPPIFMNAVDKNNALNNRRLYVVLNYAPSNFFFNIRPGYITHHLKNEE